MIYWFIADFRLWDGARLMFAIDLALASTDLVLDDNLHRFADHPVSAGAAAWFSDDAVFVVAFLFALLWACTGGRTMFREFLLPVALAAVSALKVAVTVGSPGVGVFLALVLVYAAVMTCAPWIIGFILPRFLRNLVAILVIVMSLLMIAGIFAGLTATTTS
jgi:hypothetical protein